MDVSTRSVLVMQVVEMLGWESPLPSEVTLEILTTLRAGTVISSTCRKERTANFTWSVKVLNLWTTYHCTTQSQVDWDYLRSQTEAMFHLWNSSANVWKQGRLATISCPLRCRPLVWHVPLSLEYNILVFVDSSQTSHWSEHLDQDHRRVCWRACMSERRR